MFSSLQSHLYATIKDFFLLYESTGQVVHTSYIDPCNSKIRKDILRSSVSKYHKTKFSLPRGSFAGKGGGGHGGRLSGEGGRLPGEGGADLKVNKQTIVPDDYQLRQANSKKVNNFATNA